jgi:hypothetical protein
MKLPAMLRQSSGGRKSAQKWREQHAPDELLTFGATQGRNFVVQRTKRVRALDCSSRVPETVPTQ